MSNPFWLPSGWGVSYVANAASTLVFNTHPSEGPTTGFIDLRAWPPETVRTLGAGTLHASRSRAGRWLLHQYVGKVPYTWRLRLLARAFDETPLREEPEPLPTPDLSEILPHLDCDASRSLEVGDARALDGAILVGELPLVVPRQIGLGGRHHPLVLRDGAWVEERGLPAYTKLPSKPRDSPNVYAVSLADGGEVLVWDGLCFELTERGFARTFERPIDPPSSYSWFWAPAGPDGFFFVDNSLHLTEVHRGDAPPRVHLPELCIYRMWPGPDGTMILRDANDNILLYDPREETFAEIPRELVPKDPKLVFYCDTGHWVVADREWGAKLTQVPRSEIDALPRKHATPEARRAMAPLRDASAALSGGRPVSRPLIAAHGPTRTIVTAWGSVVEGHHGDAPRWRKDLPAEVVALVADDRHVSVLDETGALHGMALADGARIGVVTLGPHPRSLAAAANGTLAVLEAGGVHLVDEHGIRKLPFELPLAASFDGDGKRLLLTGERRRAALITVATGAVDALPEPPGEVHAVLWMGGDTWMALAEQAELRLDVTERVGESAWRVESAIETGNHLARSPRGTRLAVSLGKHLIDFVAADTGVVLRSLSYPDTFQDDEPLAVTGISFLGENEVAVGLSRGNANLIDLRAGTASRLDPFPGGDTDRWVFIYDGHILVAG